MLRVTSMAMLVAAAHSALLHLRVSPHRTPPPRMSSSVPLSELTESLPFAVGPELLSEAVEYRGFGVSLQGRSEYTSAQAAFERQIPSRLRHFAVSDVQLLPADGRGLMVGRYTVSFAAPVPPQYMPEQRRRLARANLTRTADGLAPVEARIACTLRIDPTTGLVLSHTESLAVDPFAVTATIAHFEYCYARQLALSVSAAETPGPLDIATAYYRALRELTRRELDWVVKENRRGSDVAALQGGDPDADVTDAEFERWFAVYVGRNFVAGGALGAVAYLAIRALREGAGLLSASG